MSVGSAGARAVRLSLAVLCGFLSPALASPLLAAEARVLGIAQDGGVPHIGCTQALCAEARRDNTVVRSRRSASLQMTEHQRATFLSGAVVYLLHQPLDN